jgi:hypothetical protein
MPRRRRRSGVAPEQRADRLAHGPHREVAREHEEEETERRDDGIDLPGFDRGDAREELAERPGCFCGHVPEDTPGPATLGT